MKVKIACPGCGKTLQPDYKVNVCDECDCRFWFSEYWTVKIIEPGVRIKQERET